MKKSPLLVIVAAFGLGILPMGSVGIGIVKNLQPRRCVCENPEPPPSFWFVRAKYSTH